MTEEKKAFLVPTIDPDEQFSRIKQFWYRYCVYYKLQWFWILSILFLGLSIYAYNYIPLFLTSIEIPKRVLFIESKTKDIFIRAEIPRYVADGRTVTFSFVTEQADEPNPGSRAVFAVDAIGAGTTKSTSAGYSSALSLFRPWESEADIEYKLPARLTERKISFDVEIKLSGYSAVRASCGDKYPQLCIRVVRVPIYIFPAISALSTVGFFGFASLLLKEHLSKKEPDKKEQG